MRRISRSLSVQLWTKYYTDNLPKQWNSFCKGEKVFSITRQSLNLHLSTAVKEKEQMSSPDQLKWMEIVLCAIHEAKREWKLLRDRFNRVNAVLLHSSRQFLFSFISFFLSNTNKINLNEYNKVWRKYTKSDRVKFYYSGIKCSL